MIARPLDLDAVQAFICIADFGSFTRAAEVLETTQAAVSLKLKRLETRLGWRLVERTPRYVQLSARGAAFLEHARELLETHDRALGALASARQRLTIGISDRVAALAPRMVSFGAVDVGRKLRLPELPRLPILLHSRVKSGRPREALAALSAAFRSAVRK